MKNHVHSFSRFSRIYESLEDPSEEPRLDDLYKQSTEALMAEVSAGTADGFSFLKWIDTVCDIIDSTQMKGAIMSKAKAFINQNLKVLHPMMKEVAQYPQGSANARHAAKIKSRFTNVTKEDTAKISRAEELQRKYGLM